MERTVNQDGITVIVCCYNSSRRIAETLQHLALQKTVPQLLWEIVLVDNASDDDTATRAHEWWSSKGLASVPLRIVAQPIPGLSHARSKGIESSTFGSVIFCDDDNWLSADYVQHAYQLLLEDPAVGILGGWCTGIFEIPLRNYLIPMQGAIAICPSPDHNIKNPIVNGAGMVMRKSCYKFLMESGGPSLLVDRKGNQLSSGGDSEICWKAIYAGYAIRGEALLYFEHFIPAGRLKASYFLRLCLSQVMPVIILQMYSYVYRADKTFGQFMKNLLADHLKKIFHYLPRLVAGKYKFHALIYFLQSGKVTLLAVWNYREVKKLYSVIRRKHQNLAGYTYGK